MGGGEGEGVFGLDAFLPRADGNLDKMVLPNSVRGLVMDLRVSFVIFSLISKAYLPIPLSPTSILLYIHF